MSSKTGCLLYSCLIRPLLFCLDPERAHETAVNLLEIFQKSKWICRLLQKICSGPERPVKVAGLSFPNPVGLAAGFDKDCRVPKVSACLGFGFLELGTVTLRPQDGNPKPRLFRIPEKGAILNRMGFNNIGAEAAASNLKHIGPAGIPVGINIGKNADCALDDAPANYAGALKILYPYADYFSLNISSPNTRDLRRMHEPMRLRALLDSVLSAGGRKKPLFIKISPDISSEELGSVAEIALEYKTGIIATNTTTSRRGLDRRWESEEGGVSGSPLKSLSNSVLSKIRKITAGRIPIIGAGGVADAESFEEKLSLGADLVQLYTGFIYEGPFTVKKLLTEGRC